jgi:hypothetical protein
MFVEPSTVATMAFKSAWQHRQYLWTKLRRIIYRVRNGHLQVIIIGPAGTGKSTLADFLLGRLDLPVPSQHYTESITTESFSYPGPISATLLVAAGQERRQPRQWGELYRSLAEGASTAVINVTSYGYHSFGEASFQEHRLYRSGMSLESFMSEYTTDRRNREISVMQELVPHLLNAKRRLWMLTLVTKQDLWWDDRIAVRDHYTKGPYNDLVERVMLHRGQQHFVHEYLSGSLIMCNFATSTHQLLAATVAGYDNSIQYAHRGKLLETIDSFAHRPGNV